MSEAQSPVDCNECGYPEGSHSPFCAVPIREINELARKAVEFQKNDKRTEAEIIRDGVAFIMDTRVGGP